MIPWVRISGTSTTRAICPPLPNPIHKHQARPKGSAGWRKPIFWKAFSPAASLTGSGQEQRNPIMAEQSPFVRQSKKMAGNSRKFVLTGKTIPEKWLKVQFGWPNLSVVHLHCTNCNILHASLCFNNCPRANAYLENAKTPTIHAPIPSKGFHCKRQPSQTLLIASGHIKALIVTTSKVAPIFRMA